MVEYIYHLPDYENITKKKMVEYIYIYHLPDYIILLISLYHHGHSFIQMTQPAGRARVDRRPVDPVGLSSEMAKPSEVRRCASGICYIYRYIYIYVYI